MGSPVEAVAEAHESGGASGGSSDVGASSSIPGGAITEESGGSRWPRQQTLALLKIRSDMDPVFRDASLKAPLWEEVSRKMAELGFQRSAKKCREKFENVYKYHKRTKDGRASKPDGKTYRFFDQLEALENNPFSTPRLLPPSTAAPPVSDSNLQLPSYAASLPTSPTPLSVLPPNIAPPPPQMGSNPMNSSSQFQHSQPPPPVSHGFQPTHFQFSTSLLENSMSSSSTSSDEDIQRRQGRKRKWKDYLQKLMRDVIQKQDELQKRFLEALEKGERDRIAREEAWRVQEMARKNREHDLLVQERSMAAAKDAAVVAFLQKITDQQNLKLPLPVSLPLPILPQMPVQIPPPPQPPAMLQQPPPAGVRDDGGGDSGFAAPASSSRWPKTEVVALIKLRTSLDLQYQDSGPKGPLWEEISAAMGKLGYNRSSKRCKEKWENINKYYKKVKESNKKRPEDSKTCPYFHQLEAIYKERSRTEIIPSFSTNPISTIPPLHQPAMHNPIPDDVGLNNNNNDTDEEEDDEEDVEDDDAGGYEMIPNQQQQQPSSTAE